MTYNPIVRGFLLTNHLNGVVNQIEREQSSLFRINDAEPRKMTKLCLERVQQIARAQFDSANKAMGKRNLNQIYTLIKAELETIKQNLQELQKEISKGNSSSGSYVKELAQRIYKKIILVKEAEGKATWKELLTKITSLNFSYKNIELLIPEMTQLTNLRSLSLEGNPITSYDVLAKLNLHQLDISCCGITNVPNEISSLTSLYELKLRTNEISEIPIFFTELTRLQELDLSNNRLEKIPIDLINKMTSLKRLDVNGNPVKEIPIDLEEIIVEPIPYGAKWVDT